MLAAVIIIVFLLFALGLGLLISGNALIVLIFAIIGLMVGGLVGAIIFRSRMMNIHWAVFIGPLGMGMLFILSCAVIDLWIKDLIGLPIPLNDTTRLRFYVSALFLGTLPGLIVGWLLGVTLSNTRNTQPTQTQRGMGGTGSFGRQQTGRYSPGVGGQQPGGMPRPTAPLPPGSPQPMGGGTGMMSSSQSLIAQVSNEQASLTQFGNVQILNPNDGTVCVLVTRYDDGTKFYLVCSAAYPNQPPVVRVERNGMELPVGSGILFPWNGLKHRLAHVMDDLTKRV